MLKGVGKQDVWTGPRISAMLGAGFDVSRKGFAARHVLPGDLELVAQLAHHFHGFADGDEGLRR